MQLFKAKREVNPATDPEIMYRLFADPNASKDPKLSGMKDEKNVWIYPFKSSASMAVAGYKVHVGIGMHWTGEEGQRAFAAIYSEITALLENMDPKGKKIDAKFATMPISEMLSEKGNPQRGKQITVYVPEEHRDMIPNIVNGIAKILNAHAGDYWPVKADSERNVSLVLGGVISMRYSSDFMARNKEIDGMERATGGWSLMKNKGKVQDAMEIIGDTQRMHEVKKLVLRWHDNEYLNGLLRV